MSATALGLRVLLVALGLAILPSAAPAKSAGDTYVIDHVDVIPMDTERVLRDQTVVVSERRIKRMGASGTVPLPPGAQLIDGRNRYLIPGIAEMHAHIPGPIQGLDLQNRVLDLFLVNGVTTVRGMLGDPQHLRLRAAIASHGRVAPHIVTSGPSFSGQSVKNVRDVVTRVRQQNSAGYDFLKIHPGLGIHQFNALVESASEAGIPIAGHVSLAVGLDRVLAAGQASIDHLDGYVQKLAPTAVAPGSPDNQFFGLALAPVADRSQLGAVARRTAQAGVWNVPTQILIENIAGAQTTASLMSRDEMRYMPAATVRRWATSRARYLAMPGFDRATLDNAIALRRELIEALHVAGAGLLLGSDAPQVFNVPGFSAHHELEVLTHCGLTPYQALATATINPARFLGMQHHAGGIAEGYDADLVLLNGNPLESILNTRRIQGVMAHGVWLDRATLDSKLARWADQ